MTVYSLSLSGSLRPSRAAALLCPLIVLLLSRVFGCSSMPDENGAQLWLRYKTPSRAPQQPFEQVVVERDSATCRVIRSELRLALPRLWPVARPTAARALVIGTPQTSSLV